MAEILQNVEVFAPRRRRQCHCCQGYDNTSMFSLKTVKLKNERNFRVSDFGLLSQGARVLLDTSGLYERIDFSNGYSMPK